MKNRCLLFIIIWSFFIASSLAGSCNRCSDKTAGSSQKPGASEKSSADSTDKSNKPSPKISPYPSKNELIKTAKQAQKAFKAAFESNPKDPETWRMLLKSCNALTKAENDDAFICFDRFFKGTADVEMDDWTMANAYRQRIHLAVAQGKAADAAFYSVKLRKIEEKLILDGNYPHEIQAYSAYLHAGALNLQGRNDEALAELERAIKLYYISKETDPGPLLDYLSLKADMAVQAGKRNVALKALEALEKEQRKIYGEVHPVIGLTKLKRVNILLDIGDKAGAASEWDYVDYTVGKMRKSQLPPEVYNLHMQTLIRIGMEGLEPKRPR